MKYQIYNMPKPRYECDRCHKIFCSLNGCNKHINNNTCVGLEFFCEYCNNRFAKKSGLSYHKKYSCKFVKTSSQKLKEEKKEEKINKSISYNGYIYLIREREFVRLNENVYKIGKSIQENCRRIKDYPNNSELICILPTKNVDEIETKLKKEFTKEFTLCKDYGSEYFEGDCRSMMDRIYQSIQT